MKVRVEALGLALLATLAVGAACSGQIEGNNLLGALLCGTSGLAVALMAYGLMLLSGRA